MSLSLVKFSPRYSARECWNGFCRTHISKFMVDRTEPLADLRRKRRSDEAAMAHPRTTSKIKLALLVGYNGKDYFGSEKSSLEEQEKQFPSIEGTLEKALLEAGLIRESNFGNLKKIGWSRGSRTDKGVHAAGAVFGCKIEAPYSVYENLSKSVAGMINSNLPNEVRVFDICKVRGGFDARRAQNYRTYEYLVPASVLHKPLEDEILQKFIGFFNFHNYTRARHSPIAKPPNLSLTDEQCSNLDDLQIQALTYAYDSHKNRKVEEFRQTKAQINGIEFIRFTIKGESFLYHQIRKMIGMLLCISNEIYPASMIDISLNSPFKIRIPLAPGFPLILCYSSGSFNNWRLGQDDLLSFEGRKDQIHRQLENFKSCEIYPQICTPESESEFKLWLKENLPRLDDAELSLLAQRFQEYSSVVPSKEKSHLLLKSWLAHSPI